MFFKNRKKILEQKDKIVKLLQENIDVRRENLKLTLEIEECNEVSEIECGMITDLKSQIAGHHEYIKELKANNKDSKHTEEILRQSMFDWRKRFFSETSPLKKKILQLTTDLEKAKEVISNFKQELNIKRDEIYILEQKIAVIRSIANED